MSGVLGPSAGHVLAGRWRLEGQIGSGSFGTVWSVRDEQTGDRVAAKVLHPAHAQNEKVLGRFVQEARIQAELGHPAIVPVLDWSAEPPPFLVMPLVEGESLHDRCHGLSEAGRVVPLRGITWLMEQMCGAVAAAHDGGVVHRDLKPKNVLVNRRGQRPFVKVLDFGVAKILEGGRLPATTVGRVMGSVLYLAPEQVTGGGPPTVAVDQFALASIAFELLTGRRAWARDADGAPLPFRIPVGSRGDNNQMSVLRRIVREDRPSVLDHRPEAGARVAGVIARGLDLDPEARFSDVRAFGAALREALVEAAELGPENVTAISPRPEPRPEPRPPSPIRSPQRAEVDPEPTPEVGAPALFADPTLSEGARRVTAPRPRTEVTAVEAASEEPPDPSEGSS